MAIGTLLPAPFVGLDNNGNPVSGGKLYTYAAGSTTPLTTYSDASLTTPNLNPVILDSAGRATVFLQQRAYKFVLTTSADVELWTRDNVLAYAPYSLDTSIDGVAGENLAAGSTVFLSDGSGGRTAGRWYLTDADATATSTSPISIGVVPTQILIGATGSIRIGGRATGLSGLTAGQTYYVSATAGALTSSAPANARIVGVADSTTSLVMADSTGPVPASRVSAGFFGTGDYTITGGLVVAGAKSLGAVASSGTFSFESPVFRQYTGDGTGYALEFAKRTGSSNTKLVRINETTSATLEVNGGMNVGGSTDPGDNNLRVEGTATVVGQTLVADGAVGAPGVAFAGDTDTGVYKTATNGIGVSAGGSLVTQFISAQNRTVDGAYTAPAYSFTSDTDTGIYRNGADDVRISAGAADVAGFYNAGCQIFKAATFEAGITANALGSATTGTLLVISAGNAIRPQSSSRRYKENEQAWSGDSRKILALTPKTFDYKGDGAKGVLFFIAEDVADIDPIYVNTNADGQPESIRTDSLVAALIDLVQQQERRIAALEARLS